MYNLKKIPPAAGYTRPQQCSIYTPREHRLLKHVFKFTGGYRALYTMSCTKRFLQAGWRAKTLVISYLRAATVLSTHAQNASTNCNWDAAETLSFLIHGRLRHSLHMHKTLYKKKCVGRKMRRRREKIEIQELKRSFLVLKTRKIDQNTVKNSRNRAEGAKNFGVFWRFLEKACFR